MKIKHKLTHKGDLSYATSPLLGNATHAFMGRQGGVSPAPYGSLNTALHVGDDQGCVEKNRELIRKHFGIKDKNLVIVNQVHGTAVLNIEDDLPPESTEADALITQRAEIAIAIQTADCVPILLIEPNKKIIGALHAGRKGTLNNIAGKTVDAMMQTYHAEPARIRAVIGPAVGPCCYEVSADIIKEFSGQYECDKENRRLDLPMINKIQLQEAGIGDGNIDLIKICTSCTNDMFFSYRAAKTTGRNLSLIMLAEQP